VHGAWVGFGCDVRGSSGEGSGVCKGMQFVLCVLVVVVVMVLESRKESSNKSCGVFCGLPSTPVAFILASQAPHHQQLALQTSSHYKPSHKPRNHGAPLCSLRTSEYSYSLRPSAIRLLRPNVRPARTRTATASAERKERCELVSSAVRSRYI